MTITFRCEHCRKTVEAPDAAASKRGRCPYCGKSNFIPAPVKEDELLDLAPIDEAEERRRQEQVHKLMEQEMDLLSEKKQDDTPPLEHREQVASQDLHHFVVNYCLDLHSGQLQRAQMHVQKLRQFGDAGSQAVEDFISQKVLEPAMDTIPVRLQQGFLTQLRDQLK